MWQGGSVLLRRGNKLGIKVTSFDPIYSLPPEKIIERSEPDLNQFTCHWICADHRWVITKIPNTCANCAKRASRSFSRYTTHPERYVAELPRISFADSEFDLISCLFLFAYQDRLGYEFIAIPSSNHGVTRGEARIIHRDFEAQPSYYVSILQTTGLQFIPEYLSFGDHNSFGVTRSE